MCCLTASMVHGRAARRLGRYVCWKEAVLIANPDRWSRCGCVMRYVEMNVRVIQAALALAVWKGNSTPAKGPSDSMMPGWELRAPGTGAEGVRRRFGRPGSSATLLTESDDRSVTFEPFPVAAGNLDFDAGLRLRSAGPGGFGTGVFGRCCSRMRIIPERCVPASTASNDPLAQLVAVDLTSRPVTLSSVGPPPAP